MVPIEVILSALQRVDDVLEDLDAVGWELDGIAEHPGLPRWLAPEAEQKVAQAKTMLSLVVPLVRKVMEPFAEEQAALKADQEVMLQTFREESRPTELRMPCLQKT
jgi:hypothetical protein